MSRYVIRFLLCLCLFGLFVVGCGGNEEADISPADGDGEALAECATDLDCEAGKFCSAAKRCIKSCRVNTDCIEGYCHLESGRCVECLADAHCENWDPQSYCDSLYRVCRIGCEECQSDQICVEDRCVANDEPDTDGDSDSDSENDADDEEPVAECPPAPDGMACFPDCTECVSNVASRRCRSDGSGFEQEICQGKQLCNPATGVCEDPLCTPYSRDCEGQIARLCDEDGLGYTTTECSGAEQCLDGYCLNIACTATGQMQLYSFDTHSSVATPDYLCRQSLSSGSAAFQHYDERDGALRFNGYSSRTVLPESAAPYTEGITLMAHVLLDGEPSGNQTLIAKGSPPVFELAIENGKPVFRIRTSNRDRIIEGETLSSGLWHHIAATFDGTTLNLYQNGEPSAIPAELPTQQLIDSSAAPLTIGAALNTDDSPERFFKGSLDNLYLSERAVSAEETAYFAASTQPCIEFTPDPAPDCSRLCKRQIIQVPAHQAWSGTTVVLQSGESLFVDPGGCASPSEITGCITSSGLAEHDCPDCPDESALPYSLIAKININGTPFYAGDRHLLVAGEFGSLYLGINDGYTDDNLGGFSVFVEQGYCDISPCPAGMAPLPGLEVCMDRYEASCDAATYTNSPCNSGDSAFSRPGRQPWTEITPGEAQLACSLVGKRLCKQSEWLSACQGEDQTIYPYGDDYHISWCNDRNYNAPDPYDTFTPSGSLYLCSSSNGHFDLSGNVGEYVEFDDAPGHIAMSPRGFSANIDSTCSDDLAISESSWVVGFRCCKSWQP